MAAALLGNMDITLMDTTPVTMMDTTPVTMTVTNIIIIRVWIFDYETNTCNEKNGSDKGNNVWKWNKKYIFDQSTVDIMK